LRRNSPISVFFAERLGHVFKKAANPHSVKMVGEWTGPFLLFLFFFFFVLFFCVFLLFVFFFFFFVFFVSSEGQSGRGGSVAAPKTESRVDIQASAKLEISERDGGLPSQFQNVRLRMAETLPFPPTSGLASLYVFPGALSGAPSKKNLLMGGLNSYKKTNVHVHSDVESALLRRPFFGLQP